jgi:RNA polymerase sigma-70 factor, ECF subfamily
MLPATRNKKTMMKTYLQSEDNFDVIQARQGDDLAFTRLVERYQTPVFNLCYRMLGDPNCAEDAAQESFLRAYLNLGRFDIQRSFASWLLAIAAHYCIDSLRRRKYQQVSIHQTGPDDDREMNLVDAHAANPEDELVSAEACQELHRVMGKLKPIDRAAIVLRYWYEFSEAEISETLDLSVPAVKGRLFRARREIARHLDNPGKRSSMAFALPLVQLI